MNSYPTSDGEMVLKSVIDSRTKKAKAQKRKNHWLDGRHDCEHCGKTDQDFYDPSHIISVNECQNTGRSELAWDLENIEILCRKCHMEHEKKSKIN